MARCGCASASSCGCSFSSSSDVSASGTGASGNPIVLQFGTDRHPTITCTSGTRPSAPAVGQVIVESDTGLVYEWNGTTWKLLNPPLLLAAGPLNAAGIASLPTDLSSVYIQAGHEVVSFVAGLGTLLFPVPFPNGVLVVMTNHVPGVAGGIVTPSESLTLSSLIVEGAAHDGTAFSTSQVVAYTAIGW